MVVRNAAFTTFAVILSTLLSVSLPVCVKAGETGPNSLGGLPLMSRSDLDGRWLIRIRVRVGKPTAPTNVNQQVERNIVVWLLADRYVHGKFGNEVLDASMVCDVDLSQIGVSRQWPGVINRPPIRNRWAPPPKLDLPIRYQIHVDEERGTVPTMSYKSLCFSVNLLQDSWQTKGSDAATGESCYDWRSVSENSDKLTRYRVYVNLNGEVDLFYYDGLDGEVIPAASQQVFIVAPSAFSGELFEGVLPVEGKGFVSKVAAQGITQTYMLRVSPSVDCEQAMLLVGP